jgi:hypothetical protein
MSKSKQCEKILKSGAQCSRNAQLNSEYCWQHVSQEEIKSSPDFQSNYFKEITQLPTDISKNILSDYIDYETLTEITKYSQDFKINPLRIEIKEKIENNNKIKEIYIDNDLRKTEIFNKDNVKIEESNYKNGEFEGKVYYNLTEITKMEKQKVKCIIGMTMVN